MLAFNTWVLTHNGYVPAKNIDGSFAKLRNSKGEDISFHAEMFGTMAQIWDIVLTNGEKIRCTEHHMWPCVDLANTKDPNDIKIIHKETKDINIETDALIKVLPVQQVIGISSISNTEVSEEVYNVQPNEESDYIVSGGILSL